jgi:hypothetical protein
MPHNPGASHQRRSDHLRHFDPRLNGPVHLHFRVMNAINGSAFTKHYLVSSPGRSRSCLCPFQLRAARLATIRLCRLLRINGGRVFSKICCLTLKDHSQPVIPMR